ncbi:MAG: FCD domain-containing protein, partial [Acidimicrobiales bacterium]
TVPLSSFELIDDWPPRALEDHERILHALQGHDADGAGEAMLAHVNAVTEPMVSEIEWRLQAAADAASGEGSDAEHS